MTEAQLVRKVARIIERHRVVDQVAVGTYPELAHVDLHAAAIEIVALLRPAPVGLRT